MSELLNRAGNGDAVGAIQHIPYSVLPPENMAVAGDIVSKEEAPKLYSMFREYNNQLTAGIKMVSIVTDDGPRWKTSSGREILFGVDGIFEIVDSKKILLEDHKVTMGVVGLTVYTASNIAYDETNGDIVVTWGAGTNGASVYVSKSTDEGLTWTHIELPDKGQPPFNAATGRTYVTKRDPRYSTILKTNEGWLLIAQDMQNKYYFDIAKSTDALTWEFVCTVNITAQYGSPVHTYDKESDKIYFLQCYGSSAQFQVRFSVVDLTRVNPSPVATGNIFNILSASNNTVRPSLITLVDNYLVFSLTIPSYRIDLFYMDKAKLGTLPQASYYYPSEDGVTVGPMTFLTDGVNGYGGGLKITKTGQGALITSNQNSGYSTPMTLLYKNILGDIGLSRLYHTFNYSTVKDFYVYKYSILGNQYELRFGDTENFSPIKLSRTQYSPGTPALAKG